MPVVPGSTGPVPTIAEAIKIANEINLHIRRLEAAELLQNAYRAKKNYEKAFIVFRLRPLHRNARSELKKLRKIYFYDAGIRNALINNFNSFEVRQDIGALWENFLIAERVKYNGNHSKHYNIYFWRTHQGHELDYIEESEGKLQGYEFKWRASKQQRAKDFLESYPGSSINLVNQDNFDKFLLPSPA